MTDPPTFGREVDPLPIAGRVPPMNDWSSWWPEDLEDGYDHKRDQTGFCENCGATRGEPHYKLIRREND